MSMNDAVAVAWFIVVGALAVTVAIAFVCGSQLTRMFRRYGSTVLPDVTDLVRANTPSSGLKLQRYIFTKAYEQEARPELRAKGKTVRTLSIIGLFLTALGFAIMGLAIFLGVPAL